MGNAKYAIISKNEIGRTMYACKMISGSLENTSEIIHQFDKLIGGRKMNKTLKAVN